MKLARNATKPTTLTRHHLTICFGNSGRRAGDSASGAPINTVASAIVDCGAREEDGHLAVAMQLFVAAAAD